MSHIKNAVAPVYDIYLDIGELFVLLMILLYPLAELN